MRTVAATVDQSNATFLQGQRVSRLEPRSGRRRRVPDEGTTAADTQLVSALRTFAHQAERVTNRNVKDNDSWMA